MGWQKTRWKKKKKEVWTLPELSPIEIQSARPHAGGACHASSSDPSEVLTACGHNPDNSYNFYSEIVSKKLFTSPWAELCQRLFFHNNYVCRNMLNALRGTSQTKQTASEQVVTSPLVTGIPPRDITAVWNVPQDPLPSATVWIQMPSWRADSTLTSSRPSSAARSPHRIQACWLAVWNRRRCSCFFSDTSEECQQFVEVCEVANFD